VSFATVFKNLVNVLITRRLSCKSRYFEYISNSFIKSVDVNPLHNKPTLRIRIINSRHNQQSPVITRRRRRPFSPVAATGDSRSFDSSSNSAHAVNACDTVETRQLVGVSLLAAAAMTVRPSVRPPAATCSGYALAFTATDRPTVHPARHLVTHSHHIHAAMSIIYPKWCL